MQPVNRESVFRKTGPERGQRGKSPVLYFTPLETQAKKIERQPYRLQFPLGVWPRVGWWHSQAIALGSWAVGQNCPVLFGASCCSKASVESGDRVVGLQTCKACVEGVAVLSSQHL